MSLLGVSTPPRSLLGVLTRSKYPFDMPLLLSRAGPIPLFIQVGRPFLEPLRIHVMVVSGGCRRPLCRSFHDLFDIEESQTGRDVRIFAGVFSQNTVFRG